MTASMSLFAAAATMTSIQLVDFINADRREAALRKHLDPALCTVLRHDHFMTKVPQVLGEIQAPKFLGTSTYVNGQGHSVPRSIYRFPKREACLLAMSYSYELQARVFDYMTALEAELAGKVAAAPAVPTTLKEALLLAVAQEERLEEERAKVALLSHEVEEAAPKVAAFDSVIGHRGMETLAVVAKRLAGVNSQSIKESLANNKILRRAGNRGPYRIYAAYRDSHFVERIDEDRGLATIYPTPAGVALLASLHRQGKLIMKKSA